VVAFAKPGRLPPPDKRALTFEVARGARRVSSGQDAAL
jgi:hypothetical protein